MARLELKNLTKTFPGGVHAVDGLSLVVDDGELMVLFGPSGCGKTTTLRLIAGLERPDAGTITLGGRPLDGLAPARRDVSMVFQGFALYPHLSVAGNLAFGLRLRRLPKAEIARRVAEAAELLGIGDLLARRPHTLSGGQRQRVALGRAIVRQPKLFLFDEPLSSLDAALRSRMRGEIRRLHERLRTTIIYVTHDQAEAMTLGRRIAVMRAGRLQQVGPPLELYRRPANRFVAAALGSPSMNFVEGRLERRGGGLVFVASPVGPSADTVSGIGSDETVGRPGEGRLPGGLVLPVPEPHRVRLAAYAGRPIILGVRPQHLRLLTGDAGCGGRIAARVDAIETLGAESYAYLTAAGCPLTVRLPAGSDCRPGDPIELCVGFEDVHFFDPVAEETIR